MNGYRSTQSRFFPGSGVMLVGLALILAIMTLGSFSDDTTQQSAFEQETEYAFEVSNLIFDASSELALGRGLMLLALSSDRSMARSLGPRIGRHRVAANAAFFNALQLARTNLAFPTRKSLLEAVFSSFQDLRSLRHRADLYLETRPDKIDGALVEEWFDVSTGFQDMLEELLVEVELKLQNPHVPIGPELGFQYWAWIMSEYAGRERALIASALARQSSLLTQDEAKLARYRDHLELAWQFANKQLNKMVIGRSTAAQLEAVGRVFFVNYEEYRQLVYSALAAGRPPALSAVEWFEISTQAIDSLLELGRTAAMDSRTFNEKEL